MIYKLQLHALYLLVIECIALNYEAQFVALSMITQ